MPLSRQRYSGNAIPTNYSDEGIPTTIFRHRYSDNAIPTKVFRQLYSDKGIPTLALNTCDNVFRQTYSDPIKLGEVFRSITCFYHDVVDAHNPSAPYCKFADRERLSAEMRKLLCEPQQQCSICWWSRGPKYQLHLLRHHLKILQPAPHARLELFNVDLKKFVCKVVAHGPGF